MFRRRRIHLINVIQAKEKQLVTANQSECLNIFLLASRKQYTEESRMERYAVEWTCYSLVYIY